MAQAKLIQEFEIMAIGPLMVKLKDQPAPKKLPDGSPNMDPCLYLYEDRVCTFCEEHREAYIKVSVERRMSVLKTRPLKNPFVACGKIKGAITDKEAEDAKDAYESLVKRCSNE